MTWDGRVSRTMDVVEGRSSAEEKVHDGERKSRGVYLGYQIVTRMRAIAPAERKGREREMRLRRGVSCEEEKRRKRSFRDTVVIVA